MKFSEWLQLNEMPVGVTKVPATYYHGTDSEPFTRFDPSKAAKGKQFWNPLGSGLYVTDQEYFAKNFGKNVYKVEVPAGYRYKKYTRREWLSAAHDLVYSALYEAIKQVEKVPPKRKWYWDEVPLNFKVEMGRALENNSPYEGLYESTAVVEIFYGEVVELYMGTLPRLADKKFGQYDLVVFQDTNDVLGWMDNKGQIKSSQEIVVYNPELQRAVQ